MSVYGDDESSFAFSEIEETPMDTRIDAKGDTMDSDEQRAWKRKWTVVLVVSLLLGFAAIGVLSFFLHEELNE